MPKPISYASPYAGEEEEIAQRRAYAKALQEQGQTPLGQTQMAGGWAIPQSPLEGLAKGAQQMLGAYQGNLKSAL